MAKIFDVKNGGLKPGGGDADAGSRCLFFTPESREEEDKGGYRGRPRRQEKRPGFRKDSQIDTILYVDNVGLAWYEGVTLYKTQQKAIVTMDVVPLAFIDRAVDSKTGRQFYQRFLPGIGTTSFPR